MRLVGRQHAAEAPRYGVARGAVGAHDGGTPHRVGVLRGKQGLGLLLISQLPQRHELLGRGGAEEEHAVDAVQVDHHLIEVEQEDKLRSRPPGEDVVLVAADAEEIRDATLAASGTLAINRPQGSFGQSFKVIELRNNDHGGVTGMCRVHCVLY